MMCSFGFCSLGWEESKVPSEVSGMAFIDVTPSSEPRCDSIGGTTDDDYDEYIAACREAQQREDEQQSDEEVPIKQPRLPASSMAQEVAADTSNQVDIAGHQLPLDTSDSLAWSICVDVLSAVQQQPSHSYSLDNSSSDGASWMLNRSRPRDPIDMCNRKLLAGDLADFAADVRVLLTLINLLKEIGGSDITGTLAGGTRSADVDGLRACASIVSSAFSKLCRELELWTVSKQTEAASCEAPQRRSLLTSVFRELRDAWMVPLHQSLYCMGKLRDIYDFGSLQHNSKALPANGMFADCFFAITSCAEAQHNATLQVFSASLLCLTVWQHLQAIPALLLNGGTATFPRFLHDAVRCGDLSAVANSCRVFASKKAERAKEYCSKLLGGVAAALCWCEPCTSMGLLANLRVGASFQPLHFGVVLSDALERDALGEQFRQLHMPIGQPVAQWVQQAFVCPVLELINSIQADHLSVLLRGQLSLSPQGAARPPLTDTLALIGEVALMGNADRMANVFIRTLAQNEVAEDGAEGSVYYKHKWWTRGENASNPENLTVLSPSSSDMLSALFLDAVSAVDHGNQVSLTVAPSKSRPVTSSVSREMLETFSAFELHFECDSVQRAVLRPSFDKAYSAAFSLLCSLYYAHCRLEHRWKVLKQQEKESVASSSIRCECCCDHALRFVVDTILRFVLFEVHDLMREFRKRISIAESTSMVQGLHDSLVLKLLELCFATKDLQPMRCHVGVLFSLAVEPSLESSRRGNPSHIFDRVRTTVAALVASLRGYQSSSQETARSAFFTDRISSLVAALTFNRYFKE